jgi:hypothetical protein
MLRRMTTFQVAAARAIERKVEKEKGFGVPDRYMYPLRETGVRGCVVLR